MKFKNVLDVARWRLCVGCGACAGACGKKNIALEDVLNQGIRPSMRGLECEECGKCLGVCPGVGMAHVSSSADLALGGLRKGWGPILEIWEGCAANPEIRYRGSSGGAATAVALYCLEAGIAGGVLHVGKDEGEGWRNKTVISRTGQDLLSRTGSRYSPASPCDGFEEIASSAAPWVFIGKGCDIQGLRKAQAAVPLLKEGGALSIGIFCAGTPANLGVLDLLAKFKIAPREVDEIRYRGNGWPGSFAVRLKGEEAFSSKMDYQKSWGFLQAYRPFRCYLCPDGTGEFADISCGDAWHKAGDRTDPGTSLVLARTPRGKEIIAGALKNGYLVLERAGPEALEKSQDNLLQKRSAIWGRLLAMRGFGIPAPEYKGFYLFENWARLPMKEKARSLLGTARRVVKRKYFLPMEK